MDNSLIIIDNPAEQICLLQLNRPEKRNALSIAMMKEMIDHLNNIKESSTRTVIIQGLGPSFCSGLDLSEAKDSELKQKSFQYIQELFLTLYNMPQITIAAVDGPAMAGGIGIALCCDFIHASQNSRFGFPEVHVGIVPALVGALLKTRLNENHIRELLLIGKTIDASRAHEIGMVDQLIETGSTIAAVTEFGKTLLEADTETLKKTKQLIKSLEALSLEKRFDIAIHYR